MDYKQAMALDGFYRQVPSLIQNGDISMKPQTTGNTEREILPEGDYKFVVTKWAEEPLPEWKQQGAVDWHNKNQQERAEKNNDYTPQLVESFADLPWFKKAEYVFYLKVREGEHKGKSLPCVYLPLRWNTDPKYRDRSKWFAFCKTLVPNLGKRGDVPDLDSEVVHFGATCELEVQTSKRGNQFNKIVGFAKDDSFGKRIDNGSALPVSGEVDIEKLADDGEVIPFAYRGSNRAWWL